MYSIGNKIIIASILLIIVCEFDVVSGASRNRHPKAQVPLCRENFS